MTPQRWAVGTVLASALLMVAALCRADEATARKTIENAKGTIIVDDKQEGKPVVAVIMWGSGYNVELLKELKEFKGLQKVRIGGPWITDDGLKGLSEIKTLQILEVRSPKVSDGAIKELGEALPKLKIRRASPGEIPFADGKRK